MERIGDSVGRIARSTALPDVSALADVTRVWHAAVGDAIARCAWPSRIARDGTVHVATASSTWAFELTALAPEIAERLRERLGTDSPPRLRFAAGLVPEPPPPQPAATATGARPTAGERSAAAAIAAAITDDELRERIARAAAASFARQRSGRGF